MLPISQAVASWVLEKEDFVWFNQEYRKMFDFIRDSPAYQLMREDIRQELISEFEQKRLEDLKQAEKKTLATMRQTVVVLVWGRFRIL